MINAYILSTLKIFGKNVQKILFVNLDIILEFAIVLSVKHSIRQPRIKNFTICTINCKRRRNLACLNSVLKWHLKFIKNIDIKILKPLNWNTLWRLLFLTYKLKSVSGCEVKTQNCTISTYKSYIWLDNDVASLVLRNIFLPKYFQKLFTVDVVSCYSISRIRWKKKKKSNFVQSFSNFNEGQCIYFIQKF